MSVRAPALVAALLCCASAGADERDDLLRRGHHKKVVGAALIAAGSVLDAATTAITFVGLGRAGWSLAPNDALDRGLLWGGLAGNFVLDGVLTAGIVVYCDGGALLRRAR